MKHLLPFIALIFLFIPPAFATISKGDKIPDTLSTHDQYAQEQTLETLMGENGIVLIFVRSADWCPFCQKQMIDLAENGAAISDAGYSIVTLSYDSKEILAAFSEKHNIPYTMLSDPHSEWIKTFGLLNTKMKEGSRYYGVPYPAVLIIEKDGTIKDILQEEGYKKRPEISQILSVIQTETP